MMADMSLASGSVPSGDGSSSGGSAMAVGGSGSSFFSPNSSSFSAGEQGARCCLAKQLPAPPAKGDLDAPKMQLFPGLGAAPAGCPVSCTPHPTALAPAGDTPTVARLQHSTHVFPLPPKVPRSPLRSIVPPPAAQCLGPPPSQTSPRPALVPFLVWMLLGSGLGLGAGGLGAGGAGSGSVWV